MPGEFPTFLFCNCKVHEVHPQDFRQNLLKGVMGEFQGLLALATYSEKTMLSVDPAPRPKDKSHMVF